MWIAVIAILSLSSCSRCISSATFCLRFSSRLPALRLSPKSTDDCIRDDQLRRAENGGPQSALTVDAAGKLYRVTYGDEAFDSGSVFQATPFGKIPNRSRKTFGS